MCNTCCNFDEWESCETQLKVQLLSLFLPSISSSPLSLSLPLYFPPLKHPSKLLIQGSSWWWSSFFQGLFPSGWCRLLPLLLCLPLHLHGGKSPLKDLIEAQRSSLHRNSTSKLPSLLAGWTELKHFYGLVANRQVTMTHFGQSIFFLTIFKSSSEPKAYPKWHSLRCQVTNSITFKVLLNE